MSSSQLFKDLGRVAEITYQRGLKRRGIPLPEAEVHPAFLETARGQAALALLRSAHVNLESPWWTPFWNLRERVKQAAIENGDWDPYEAGDIRIGPKKERRAPAIKPPRARPRSSTAAPRARAPKVSLSRLVSLGLREAPDSGLTVRRLVDKHLRSGKAKSTHRLFGMPVVITTTGNTVRVAFAMESR